MKNNIWEFIDLYIKGDNEIKTVTNLIKDDNNNKYYSNLDPQLMDISFEYSFNNNKLNNNLRFSYFGTNISFLRHFAHLGFDIIKLENFYFKYKKDFKDDFITISFTFKEEVLENIKIYFDIYNKKGKLILISLTINKINIVEKKVYVPFSIKSYYKSLLLLKNNRDFITYIRYIPFDILYRLVNKKLKTIKYYYRKTFKNEYLFIYIYDKYFSFLDEVNIKNNNLKIMDEIGIDFDINNGINKINYYIGLYK